MDKYLWFLKVVGGVLFKSLHKYSSPYNIFCIWWNCRINISPFLDKVRILFIKNIASPLLSNPSPNVLPSLTHINPSHYGFFLKIPINTYSPWDETLWSTISVGHNNRQMCISINQISITYWQPYGHRLIWHSQGP